MTRQRFRPQSQRQLRVGEEIRHGFARAMAHGHFRDPDLQDVAVTVTDVRVSPDLRHATIFVLPFGGGDGRALVKALKEDELLGVREEAAYALGTMGVADSTVLAALKEAAKDKAVAVQKAAAASLKLLNKPAAK